jgi:hypothetical protein
VCSKKTIAPRCRGSRSRGGRGRETRSRSLIFGRGRRSSVNDRQGDATKEHRQADLPASSIIRASMSPAREADSSAHVCAGHGVRARGRIEGETTDPTGKATAMTDPAGKTRSSQRDGRSSREGRSNGDPTGKAAAATDPTKAMKGGGRWGGSSRAGPVPDLARDDDGAGDGRSSKGEALQGEEVGGGPKQRWAVGRRVAALAWRRSFAAAGPVLAALPATTAAATACRCAAGWPGAPSAGAGAGGELGRHRRLRAATPSRGLRR